MDNATVQNLELLAPKYSMTDRDRITGLMENRTIFPSIQDNEKRRTLTDNLHAFPGVIPSLWTFFETLIYLEPFCESLKNLLGKHMKHTIRSSLMACHRPPERTVLQHSESADVEFTKNLSAKDAAGVAYIELWLFCARQLDALTSWTPKKELRDAKPMIKGPNPVVQQRLAKFAVSRGFRIPNALAMVEKEEDFHLQITLDFLRKANPIYSSFQQDHIAAVSKVSRSGLGLCEGVEHEIDSEELDVERRVGRPFEKEFTLDRKSLFFPRVFTAEPCRYASLALFRRDLFTCIFGEFRVQESSCSSYKTKALTE